MNSSREENKIYVYSSINMGIAVTNAKDFVLVPVIMNIQDKSLPEISKEVKSLAEKVRDNKITPEEMAGGKPFSDWSDFTAEQLAARTAGLNLLRIRHLVTDAVNVDWSPARPTQPARSVTSKLAGS